jgi:hypothetical protein
MSYWLFLDDERFPPGKASDWVIARTFDEACGLIVVLGLPAIMSLDHDLGDCPSGYDFAHWLTEHVIDHDLEWNVEWRVHSMNPVGAANITGLLANFDAFRGR